MGYETSVRGFQGHDHRFRGHDHGFRGHDHGFQGHNYALNYDNPTQWATSRNLADKINASIANASPITVPPDTDPQLSKGLIGKFVQTQDGNTKLPTGYNAMVDVAAKTVDLGNGDDTVHASGRGNDTIHAGSGTSTGTLNFVGGWGTFEAGSGNETLTGTSASSTHSDPKDTFTFRKGRAGETDLINNFISGEMIKLQGYGPKEIAKALDNAKYTPQGATITLSDNSKITFAGVTHLDPKQFTS